MASIKCRYKDGTTEICSYTNSFSDIKVNGVSIGLVTEYNVNSSDEVEFVLSDSTSIKTQAFAYCRNLTSVVIPDSVKTLGIYTFAYCSGLTSITLGSGVTEIGEAVFANCSGLTTITIPDSVTSIGIYAFQYCYNLTSLHIGSGVTEIKDIAFYNCSGLTTITIKSKVAPKINADTFKYVKENGTLYYPKGSDYSQWLWSYPYFLGYYGWNGVEVEDPDNPDIPTEPDNPDIPTEPDEPITGTRMICRYLDGTSKICNTTNGISDIRVNGVSIGIVTDYNVNSTDEVEFVLSESYIPNAESGYGVFQGCESLKSVTIGDGITKIGDYAFHSCTSLETLNLPNSITYIGRASLYSCISLKELNLTNVTEIKSSGLKYCSSLKKLNLPSLEYLRNNAFEGCTSLEEIHFEDKLRIVEPYAFEECASLKLMTIKRYDAPSVDKYGWTFYGIAEGGTFYYPANSRNYDTYWVYGTFDNGVNGVVNRSGLYYKDWNCIGIEFEDPDDPDTPVDPDDPDTPVDPDDPDTPVDPDDPDNPDAPSVGSDTKTIVFEASGGTQPINFTWSNVSYDDISTKAEAADSWVELDYEGLISSSPIITQYLVTAGVNTGAPRTTYFTFTGSTSSGEIKTETITIYQKNNNGDLPNDSDMSTGCYINLDSYEHTFPATGGTISVVAHFGYPSTSGLKARAFSGAVYPILWCTTENVGGGIEDDGTEASEIWEITMTNNNFDAERTATITFSYTNSYGESTSVVFTAKQEAGAGEDKTEPKVGVSSNRLNVNSDGTPEYSSTTNIKGFYQAVTINNPIVNGDWIHLGTGVEYEGVVMGYDTRIDYPISFDANDGVSRTGTITFSGIDTNGNVLTAVCNVIQASAVEEPDEPETPDIPVDGDEYIGPIWKDVAYNFGGIEMVEYGIYTEVPFRLPGNGGIRYYDKLLFAGRSYARPDTGNNVILVNKICQDYMEIPLLKQGYPSLGGGYNIFKLKSADGKTLYRQYSFVNDWSYGEFETGLLSRPILKDHSKVFRNQLLPFSVFGAAEKVTVPYEIFYADGNKWNSTVYETRGVTTTMFPFEEKKNGAIAYSINNQIYTISDECVQYVLYYVNPWGGYDWFPIRGKVVERDSMTAYTYTQNFNNQTWDFGKRRYLTEITKHFTLHTQWMSEDESSRMWYLLQSNTVYLHNLVEDKIYPVIITNTEQEHKKRLLGTRISYQIEVDLSQNRERI